MAKEGTESCDSQLGRYLTFLLFYENKPDLSSR
jgi:hypothetical protein